MVYIKKLVMKGFKSFARETEIPISNGMNVIVGPNGSGKSNVTDAICFVLGRMSIKSMRAAKAANLIFAGTKEHRSATEASVKLYLDNSDKKLQISETELIVERVLRNNGQSIYRLNHEPKTRQEVLELLATAGIDPYGFNIVLQGGISNIVKTTSEERRKIIEEVAGISIYEMRKEKSLKEMEKTEEKLKEIRSILRERTAYLRNIEEERKQAMKFKKFEELVKRYKASIINKKLEEKNKEILNEEKKREDKDKEKILLKEKLEKIMRKVEELQLESANINSLIEKSSGIEQEKLQSDISNIRADLAGLNVRKENINARLQETLLRRNRINEEIKKIESELSLIKKDFPSQAKKYQDLDKKKQEFAEIERQKKLLYNTKEKLHFLQVRIEDKKKQLNKNSNETSFILREVERISSGMAYSDFSSCSKELLSLKSEQETSLKNLEKFEFEQKEAEKMLYVYSSEISSFEKIKKQVSSIDICPLCKSKMTPEHIKEVFNDCDIKISSLNKKTAEIRTGNKSEEISKLKEKITLLKTKTIQAESDLIKLKNIEEKKEQLKTLKLEESALKQESVSIEKERDTIEKRFLEFKDVEEKYDKIFIEIQEISSRTEENLDAELEYKNREMEKSKVLLNQNIRDEHSLREDLANVIKVTEQKQKDLSNFESQEKELEKKFQKLIEKKNSIDKEIYENNSFIFEFRSKISLSENDLNNIKIEKARLDAERENLEIELQAYPNLEIINSALNLLEEKLIETQTNLQNLGSVNMRALEVYESMKLEYESISQKVEVLEKEKIELMKIIEEIDMKKKKTFMKTLNSINELFTRNFSQLSTKGTAFLELENPKEPFSAGLDIIIKVGQGKYFDVTSLSGGEQTLIALSLIFAIQEYKPYSFYIFDEIDAALDKRNSERLALLIKKYMNKGQYIIVTHNDAIITESSILYGVSMQEGISKILSLQI
ncbi:chromosome segregation protein SMC [Candidatus Pacearchaeota archaeon]|nr:chromosome segregation protein SMC [Candidatus Pacearchaeota archaeon]